MNPAYADRNATRNPFVVVAEGTSGDPTDRIVLLPEVSGTSLINTLDLKKPDDLPDRVCGIDRDKIWRVAESPLTELNPFCTVQYGFRVVRVNCQQRYDSI